ncbi:unnamed protein product [Dibothriocephalus latus]|uniref:Uncharacterized protein n=1 Tax=Dibothriocephalus latus TaxID=60516 RepID=A0A3P6TD54_DIBLA|nr:unnamed protein product [Dibothriocephalus latus]
MDDRSLVAEHCANSEHKFCFKNAEILGQGNDFVIREIIEAWHTDKASINRCVALPMACQALRTHLNEEKSKRDHKRNAYPHNREPMMDTYITGPQPEVAIISSASSSGQSAIVKPGGGLSAKRIAGLGRLLRLMAAGEPMVDTHT